MPYSDSTSESSVSYPEGFPIYNLQRRHDFREDGDQPKRPNWKRWALFGVAFLLLIVLLVGVGFGVYFVLQNNMGNNAKKEAYRYSERQINEHVIYPEEGDAKNSSNGHYPSNVPKEEAVLTGNEIVQPFGQPEMGTSPGYLKASLFHQTAMKPSVDPCIDFYEHACGGYVEKNKIPSHLSQISELRRLPEETYKNMKTLLESKESSSSEAIEKMKKIFRACLKEEDYVEDAIHVAQNEIDDIGWWPMLYGENERELANFDMQKMLETLGREHHMGAGVFSFGVERDQKNYSRRVITFDQGGLLTEMDYYLEPTKYAKELEATKKRVLRKVQQFARDLKLGGNPNMESEIEEMIQFETEVAKIMTPLHDRRDHEKQYNMVNFYKFNEEFKKASGLDLRKLALETAHPLLLPLFNDEEMRIQLLEKDFPLKIAEILKNVHPRTFQNYMLYMLFLQFNDFYGEKYRDIDFDYKREIHGTQSKPEKWRRCLSYSEGMERAYGALYVRNHFDQNSKKSMDKLVEKVKESFLAIVEENTWMDEETKEKAKIKAKEMSVNIGYREMAFDDKKLDGYYEKLVFNESDNLITISQKKRDWWKGKHAEEFMAEMDRNAFGFHEAVVNAMYAFELNSILFPAAILQFPFFDKEQPPSLNFGGIGAVIGHELTHGFDDSGKAFDNKGHLKDWWGESTRRSYDEKAKCMEEQYAEMEVPDTDGMHINGKLTLGENIADNGGIREGFRAYQMFVNEHGVEPRLPGIDKTGEQLFFHGFAAFWCSNTRPAYAKLLVNTDYHSPNKFRVNVPLLNFPEFAKAYNCPIGSPMNPEKKCAVW